MAWLGMGAEGRTRPNNWTLELLIVPTESSIACCCPLAHPSLPLVSNSNYVETAAAVVRGETKNRRLHWLVDGAKKGGSGLKKQRHINSGGGGGGYGTVRGGPEPRNIACR